MAKPPKGAQTVKVKVKCNGDGLDVSITPFAVSVDSGQSVFWEPDLKTSGKNDAEVTIVPSVPATWPFTRQPPTVPTDSGAWSGELRSAEEMTVKYNLRFTCEFKGVTRTIDVDPDIIISGGSI